MDPKPQPTQETYLTPFQAATVVVALLANGGLLAQSGESPEGDHHYQSLRCKAISCTLHFYRQGPADDPERSVYAQVSAPADLVRWFTETVIPPYLGWNSEKQTPDGVIRWHDASKGAADLEKALA